MLEFNQQLELIKRGTVEIIPQDELEKKIKNSIETNIPLKIKAGFDPSAPDLHLGHTILFRKLQNFIDCGHKVIVIIGDYTAMIGDPTGKSKTRNQLSEKEVKENAQTYLNQVSKVLDVKKAEIVFNSKWLSKMDLKNIIELTAKYTVARLLERDDFSQRYKKGEDIHMLEFLYPLLQAYDSVILKADIEVGGTDQKFNLLLARTIQKRYSQEGQIILTTPLLDGTDGTEKMSKSLGNYIGITENSKDMFGKLMSIPDNLILKYLALLTDIPDNNITDFNKQMKEGRNPKELKTILAKKIVTQYYNKKTAEREEKNFDLLFSKKTVHNDIPVIKLTTILKTKNTYTAYEIVNAVVKIVGLPDSGSKVKRIIKQGGVTIHGKKIADPSEEINIKEGMVIKYGKKKFFRHKT